MTIRLLHGVVAAVRAAGQGEQPPSGWLVGLLPHDAAPPVVLHAVTATGPEQFEAIEAALPAGLALVGAYGASSWLAAAEVTRSLGGGNAQRWGATPISARMEPGSAQVDWSHGSAAVTVEVLPEGWMTEHVTVFRCRGSYAFRNSSPQELKAHTLELMEQLSSQGTFRVHSAAAPSTAIGGAGSGGGGSGSCGKKGKKGSSKVDAGGLVASSPSTYLVGAGLGRSDVDCGAVSSGDLLAPVAVDTMLLHDNVTVSTTATPTAPRVAFVPIEGTAAPTLTVHTDLLAYAPAAAPLTEAVTRRLLPGIRLQLLAAHTPSASLPISSEMSTYHFALPAWPMCVSIAYPLPRGGGVGPTEEQALKATRLRWHLALGLPEDRPLLRVANTVGLEGGSGGDNVHGRLKNPHIGVPPSHVSGGKQYLVQGDYLYYHYMQDKFDDKGWGCAYRSLQTLCSWFLLQHYTSVPTPGHRQIQQTLVALDDKPASFVGSCKWIGAIELSYILDELLGVTCKVMTVSRGDELPNKARELAHHFSTQGTPIMIGGGVLAYTLLGVDWNEATGDCSFLILDPHYTGGEDLQAIQGPWCGWKRGDAKLFVADAFYNLLCPQRPKEV